MQRKIRVLVGKPGLDGHDRGAKVVAAALRDAGMEVIYTGLHQTPEQVVEAAVQEDVDVVALSILSGAHMTLFPEVLALMRARGIGDRLLTGGGIIPPEDMEHLSEQGVGRLFGPGSSTADIAAYIRAWFVAQHGEESLAPAPPPTPQGALFEAEITGGWTAATPEPAAARPRARATTTRRAPARRRPAARGPGARGKGAKKKAARPAARRPKRAAARRPKRAAARRPKRAAARRPKRAKKKAAARPAARRTPKRAARLTKRAGARRPKRAGARSAKRATTRPATRAVARRPARTARKRKATRSSRGRR